jgi:hypothetical protein
MGTFVVVKRIAFLAGGIAHSVLGGMGAAVYFGFDPLLGALPAAVLGGAADRLGAAAWRTRKTPLISALWAIGMAVGILFIAKAPGYATDLMSFLFGNILLVPRESCGSWPRWTCCCCGRGCLSPPVLAVAFDEEFARLRGVPVAFFYLLLLVLVAVTVVLMIQVVGLILVMALLTLPAAVAGHYGPLLGRHDADRDAARRRADQRRTGPVLRPGPAAGADHHPAGGRRLCAVRDLQQVLDRRRARWRLRHTGREPFVNSEAVNRVLERPRPCVASAACD